MLTFAGVLDWLKANAVVALEWLAVVVRPVKYLLRYSLRVCLAFKRSSIPSAI